MAAAFAAVAAQLGEISGVGGGAVAYGVGGGNTRTTLLDEAMDALIHIYTLNPSRSVGVSGNSLEKPVLEEPVLDGQGQGQGTLSRQTLPQPARQLRQEGTDLLQLRQEGTDLLHHLHDKCHLHLTLQAALVETACLDAARCLCGIISDPALSLRKEVRSADLWCTINICNAYV
jgi:hypothetical protein